MTSVWDPAYVWRQCGKLLGRSDSQGQVQEVVPIPQDLPPSTGASVLSSRDLVLISGAAAVGGALVVAAVYGTPLLLSRHQLKCPVCGCDCCACYFSHQRPVEFMKKLLKRLATSVDAGKVKIQHAVGLVPRSEEHPDNNGSWTCIQVSRDNETSTTSVDVEDVGQAQGEQQIEASPGLPDPYSPMKRKGYLSWDDYFMSIAFLSAQRSKDPVRQVGACLVSQDYVILGIGYNGFPRGCSDDKLPWAKMSKDGDVLKTKYPYVCHAEVNAILNKNHASATGQRLYVTKFPCNECAKIIIQAGIAEVIFYTDKQTYPDYQSAASRKLLSLANVKLWQHQPKAKSIILEF